MLDLNQINTLFNDLNLQFITIIRLTAT